MKKKPLHYYCVRTQVMSSRTHAKANVNEHMRFYCYEAKENKDYGDNVVDCVENKTMNLQKLILELC